MGALPLAATLSLVLLVPAGPAAAAPAGAGAGATAKALARAGVLRSADLPGFARQRLTVGTGDRADERAFNSCLGIDPRYVARNYGFSYSKGALSVDSSADVAPTAAAARADMAGFRSDRAPGCVEDIGMRAAERAGFEAASMSVGRIAVRVAGADETVAYVFTLVAELGDEEVRVEGYQIAVRVGRTEISLVPLTVDAPAPDLERALKLAGTVAGRVRAAA